MDNNAKSRLDAPKNTPVYFACSQVFGTILS